MLNVVHINTTSNIPSTDVLPSLHLPPFMPPAPSDSPSDQLPISPHIKTIQINDLYTTPIPLPPPDIDHDITTSICAEIDTGAIVTCTNMVDTLHSYRPYGMSFPCPFKLTGAVDNKPIYPLDKGFIRVPTSTPTKYAHTRFKDFTPTAIYKYSKAGAMSLAYNHTPTPPKSFMKAIHNGPEFHQDCLQATVNQKLPFGKIIAKTAPIHFIKATTEHLHWH
eukprot:jgi/Psemu1/54921/gm1.54921_g